MHYFFRQYFVACDISTVVSEEVGVRVSSIQGTPVASQKAVY